MGVGRPTPPLDWKRSRRRRSPRLAAFFLSLSAASLYVPFAWAQDAPDAEIRDPQGPVEAQRTRVFSATPTIGVQGMITDNAEGVEDDRTADFILRGLLGVEASIESSRTTGQLSAMLTYDQYAKLSDLSGFSINAIGSGAYELASDTLWIEANGAVVNARNTPFGASAVDRSGVAGRTQLALYEIGPRVAATIADLLEIAASAKFGQIFYREADASVVDTPLPDDDSTVHATFLADTADRIRAYQLLTSGQFDDDDQGFRAGNLTQSLFARISPRLRLIARVGYDWVRQLGITDIEAPRIMAGFEYSPNERSRISFEGGERYDRPAYAASADFSLHDRVVLRGAYTEAIEPDQLLVASSFRRFVDQPEPIPPFQPPGDFIPPPGIYPLTSLNKVATIDATYRDDRQTVKVASGWIDRKFLPADTHDRTLTASVGYERALRPDLQLRVDVNYARTFESPLYGENESYGLVGQLDYRLNSSTTVNAAYAFAYSDERFPGGQTIYDNTVFVTLTKSF
jgi:hypothetical protein